MERSCQHFDRSEREGRGRRAYGLEGDAFGEERQASAHAPGTEVPRLDVGNEVVEFDHVELEQRVEDGEVRKNWFEAWERA